MYHCIAVSQYSWYLISSWYALNCFTLVYTNNNTCSFLGKSSLAKLDTSRTVILPPMAPWIVIFSNSDQCCIKTPLTVGNFHRFKLWILMDEFAPHHTRKTNCNRLTAQNAKVPSVSTKKRFIVLDPKVYCTFKAKPLKIRCDVKAPFERGT